MQDKRLYSKSLLTLTLKLNSSEVLLSAIEVWVWVEYEFNCLQCEGALVC